MEILAAALQALVETVARSREIAERAKVNGKVVLGPSAGTSAADSI